MISDQVHIAEGSVPDRVIFGDNLPVLRALPPESVGLVYVDPPFNTGRVQRQTRLKTTVGAG